MRHLFPNSLLMCLMGCGLQGEAPSPGDSPGTETRSEEGHPIPAELPAPVQHRAVILVTLDTLRADHLSLHGYQRETAPFLTELAGRSVVFERAHATMSYTGPSHSSMLTGLHPFQHGVMINGRKLDPTIPSVGSAFAAAGYKTGAFISTKFLKSITHGFEHRWSGRPGSRDVTGNALKWIRRMEPDQPFFVWLHLFDVHQWQAGKPLPLDHSLAGQPGPPEDDAWYDYQAQLHGWPEHQAEDSFPEFKWDSRGEVVKGRAKLMDTVDRYDARIQFVDESLRLFFEGVSELLGDDPVLWVVTSDHGEGLGSHKYKGHSGAIYQEQLHVPLVVFQDPPLDPRRVPDVVSLVDLAPTLTASLGAPLQTSEARSLWPLIHGVRDQPARAALAQRSPVVSQVNPAAGDVFALIHEGGKYLYRTKYKDAYYDLEQDPTELSGEPSGMESQALRTLLHAKLKALEWRVSDQDADYSGMSPEILEELKTLGYVE